MKYAKALGARLAGYALVGLAEVPMHDLYDVNVASTRAQVTVREQWRERERESASEYYRTRAKDGMIAAEVSALAVGDYAMVGIPAELFTTSARQIREHSPYPITSVMSLTNGNLHYVAESDAFFEGSIIYGAENRVSEMTERGTGEILAKAGIEVLRKAKGRSE